MAREQSCFQEEGSRHRPKIAGGSIKESFVSSLIVAEDFHCSLSHYVSLKCCVFACCA